MVSGLTVPGSAWRIVEIGCHGSELVEEAVVVASGRRPCNFRVGELEGRRVRLLLGRVGGIYELFGEFNLLSFSVERSRCLLLYAS